MDIVLKCKCGKVKGVAKELSPKMGNHIICMCNDCQAYIKYLGREEDILDQYGGTEIFQITPSQVKISEGSENISCLRLSPKGLMRWHTKCCNSPIANSMESSKVPFHGVFVRFMDFENDSDLRQNSMGEVIARTWARFPKGEAPKEAQLSAQMKAIFKSLKLLAMGWLRKKYSPSPFFNSKTGEPIVKPLILSKEQREQLF